MVKASHYSTGKLKTHDWQVLQVPIREGAGEGTVVQGGVLPAAVSSPVLCVLLFGVQVGRECNAEKLNITVKSHI